MLRTIFALAALAYGAMPMTGMAAPVADLVQMSAPGVAHHARSVPTADAVHHGMHDVKASSDDGDCTHPGKAMAKGHCAACLSLAAEIRIADAGPPARGALGASRVAALTSHTAPPRDPPPRV